MSKKKVLSQIVKENDIHNIAPADYRQLAKEIRAKLVRSVSRTGGHLASKFRSGGTYDGTSFVFAFSRG